MSSSTSWLAPLFALAAVSAMLSAALLVEIAHEAPGLVPRMLRRLLRRICCLSGSERVTAANFATTDGSRSTLRFAGEGVRSAAGAAAADGRGGYEDELVSQQPRQPQYEWEVDPETIRLERQIGRGSFGQVYKAEWQGATVALKTMLPQLQGKEPLVQRFCEEMKIMSMLHHENVRRAGTIDGKALRRPLAARPTKKCHAAVSPVPPHSPRRLPPADRSFSRCLAAAA